MFMAHESFHLDGFGPHINVWTPQRAHSLMHSAGGAVEFGGFSVDCGVAGVEPDSQSALLFCALSILCTVQHGSTVHKGCSVSASGVLIIYAFNPIPPLNLPSHSPSNSPLLLSSPFVLSLRDARSVSNPPSQLLLTQFHVDSDVCAPD